MNVFSGIGDAVSRLVTLLGETLRDPAALQRAGLWGIVAVIAAVVLGFLVPVGLLCLAYALVNRSKKPPETPEQGEGSRKTE